MSQLLDSGVVIALLTLVEAGGLAAFGYLCWHQSGLLAVILGASIVYSNAAMLYHATALLERLK